MPESPPKRMTRARAKAVESSQGTTKNTRTTRTATNPTNKATTKRKTRTDDVSDVVEQVAEPLATTRGARSTATRGIRGKNKAAADPEAESQNVEGQKQQPGAQSEQQAPVHSVRATRGRPRKTPVEPQTQSNLSAAKAEPRKITRGTRAAAPTTARAQAKKQVTFEDVDQDKENLILPSGKAKRTAAAKADVEARSTGLRAKPVRRPASGRTTKRKEEQAEEKTNPREKAATQPLSPKKAKQVATASSQSSEDDELAGPSTPMKPFTKSPVKMPGTATGKKEISKLDLKLSDCECQNELKEVSSPTKGMGPSIMASPARRPPASPFKDALKESPRKINLGESMKPASSLRLQPSGTNSFSVCSTTPFKASLLQSPARRPPPSTVKRSTQDSLGKVQNLDSVTGVMSARAPVKPLQMPAISPGKRFVSPVRLEKIAEPSEEKRTESVEQTKVDGGDHAKSPITEFTQSNEEDGLMDMSTPPASPPHEKIQFGSPKSSKIPRPIKTPPQSPTRESRHQNWSLSKQPEPITIDEPTVSCEDKHGPDPSDPSSQPTLKSFNIATPATVYPSDGSDSEDELQSIPPTRTTTRRSHYSRVSSKGNSIAETPLHFTPAKTPKTALVREVVQRNPFTAMEVGEHMNSTHIDETSMTPLAKQLESWKASSLEKVEREVLEGNFQGPLSKAPFPVFGMNEIWNDEPEDSPIKATSFFEDEMSVRDREFDSRVSLGEVQEEEDENVSGEDGPVEEGSGEDDIEGDIADADGAGEHRAVMDGAEEDADTYRRASRYLSDSSQEYGDENSVPIDPVLLAEDKQVQSSNVFCTPAKILSETSREIHTVSKVPLRAAGDDSPSRKSVKRSFSIPGPISSRKGGASPGLKRSNTVISYTPQSESSQKQRQSAVSFVSQYHTPTRPTNLTQQQTPASLWSKFGTPGRTPRSDLNPKLLCGAVIYVDVHTTEGADASGIFVELLTQMGARCVKQWNWNPIGATISADSSNTEVSPSAAFGLGGSATGLKDVGEVGTPGGSGQSSVSGGGKIGITHVVYKDGGKRTLEKVRQTKGVVLCVGVGWVLDCETENKWLDESPYSVDISMVPRGGHKRRKSMEPRALSNVNGHVVPSSNATPGGVNGSSMTPMPTPASASAISLAKEFLNLSSSPVGLSSPSSPTPSATTPPPPPPPPPLRASGTPATNHNFSPPQTHSYQLFSATTDVDDMTYSSPATPYYLDNLSALAQRTCPPKQAGERLFFPPGSPTHQNHSHNHSHPHHDTATTQKDSGGLTNVAPLLPSKEDERRERDRRDMDAVRRRLLLAKRKTLQFAPKIGSPLARGGFGGGNWDAGVL
ncbi:MAG: hypothetical protein M1837_000759 [Sclerophora amabilis]|nr:MAG: hypothetical protein M1837_000759 [Sclerophora amabilis]